MNNGMYWRSSSIIPSNDTQIMYMTKGGNIKLGTYMHGNLINMDSDFSQVKLWIPLDDVTSNISINGKVIDSSSKLVIPVVINNMTTDLRTKLESGNKISILSDRSRIHTIGDNDLVITTKDLLF